MLTPENVQWVNVTSNIKKFRVFCNNVVFECREYPNGLCVLHCKNFFEINYQNVFNSAVSLNVVLDYLNNYFDKFKNDNNVNA